MTAAGIILGTAAYMAPEQARGKAVDKRADIWAFGVVLYEMLVGRRLFEGESVTDILANVVKEQPDLSAAPIEVRRLLEACLRKDPRQRLQAIGDWKLLLDVGEAHVSSHTLPRRAWLPWLLAGTTGVLLAVLAVVHFREARAVEHPGVRRWAVCPDRADLVRPIR
jgi:eukaryotic-like serine/threonine-protein kinase